jgi:hypothetical protein
MVHEVITAAACSAICSGTFYITSKGEIINRRYVVLASSVCDISVVSPVYTAIRSELNKNYAHKIFRKLMSYF